MRLSLVLAFALACDENNPCSDNRCCSYWGFCGVDKEYCSKSERCVSNCWNDDGILDTSPVNWINECGGQLECPLGLCCSKWGYCGITDEYCSPPDCQSSCVTQTDSVSQTSTTTPQPSVKSECSASKLCPNSRCCSKWGFCGVSESHCKVSEGCLSGCQSEDYVDRVSDPVENPLYDPRGVYSSCDVKSRISLSFYAMPGTYTVQILDTLKTRNLKANFFFVGNRISGNESILLRAYQEGHLIGVVSQNNLSMSGMTKEDIEKEVISCAQSVRNVIGVFPTYLMTPQGYIDDLVIQTVTDLGYKVMRWNLESTDWSITASGGTSLDLFNWIKSQFDRFPDVTKKGLLALFQDYEITANALVSIIDEAERRRYEIVKVSDCFGDTVQYLEDTNCQNNCTNQIDYSNQIENPHYDIRGLFSSCDIKGTFMLSFDDGPGLYTEQILDTLKEFGIKATFFVVGRHITGRESTLLRAYQEGHLIASHTHTHPDLTTLTVDEIIDEMNQTAEAIKQVIGVYPKYMRPPYGAQNELVVSTLIGLGYKIILWNLDSKDWEVYLSSGSAQDLVSKFETELDSYPDILQKGIFALQHDLYQVTADSLSDIIADIKQRNYRFVKVNECFGDSAQYRQTLF